MFSTVTRALLLALLPLVVFVAPASATGTGSPSISSPAANAQMEVGFSGPIAVDFSDAPDGDYYVRVYSTSGSSYDDTETVTSTGSGTEYISIPTMHDVGEYVVEVYPSVDSAPAHSAATQFSVVAPPPPATPPSAPEGTHTGHIRSHRATLYWASPADDGQSRITGYRVEREGIEGVSPNRYFNTGPSTLRHTFYRLRNGLTWRFRVRATNDAGAGPWSKWVHARPDTPVFNSCFTSKRKPHHWQLACGDGNAYFDHARWTHWTGTYASGTAREWYNTCKPYCAAGNYHKFRVKIRLDRVRITKGHTYFKRFRYGRTRLSQSIGLPSTPPYPGQG